MFLYILDKILLKAMILNICLERISVDTVSLYCVVTVQQRLQKSDVVNDRRTQVLQCSCAFIKTSQFGFFWEWLKFIFGNLICFFNYLFFNFYFLSAVFIIVYFFYFLIRNQLCIILIKIQKNLWYLMVKTNNNFYLKNNYFFNTC